MQLGRPTEYREEYVDKVDEYLTKCQDEIEEYHKTRGEKSDSYDRLVRVRLPSVEGFALFLGVSKKSLYNWAKDHSDFLHALEKIELVQKQRLMEGGLSGDYNPVISKLILSANHGMREKTDADITTGGERLVVMPLEVTNRINAGPSSETSGGN